MDKVYSNMKLNDLKEILKEEIKKNSLDDLYQLSFYFNDETRYLPETYKEEYTTSVQNVIIRRFISLKNDVKYYEGIISRDDSQIINELLNDDCDNNIHILNIIVIYATYFLKEPIHNSSTVFPGNKKICRDSNYYYCPIKKYHIDNDKSLCRYCVAKILEEEFYVQEK